jgi:histidyl-tRNA synthetase
MVGESEMQSGQLSVKNMVTGEQGAMTIDELAARF